MPRREPAHRTSRRAVLRAHRAAVAEPILARHGGVATRQQLIRATLSPGDIRVEVEAGRWHRLGVHTIGVTVREATGSARWWWAVWESGSGAVLDGVTALQAGGLEGWAEEQVHVSVPADRVAHRLDGVALHRPRRTGALAGGGLPRVRPEIAALNAAQWARSDRQAATVLAMTVQQGLVPPGRLLARWDSLLQARRRELLDGVIKDICDGAQSLGELDFAAMCRARGLPTPSRQFVRRDGKGRVYLDVYWDDLKVHVEINGHQHYRGLAPVDDALRTNAVALGGAVCLQIPVLGLRLYPVAFMDQVAAALARPPELVVHQRPHPDTDAGPVLGGAPLR